MNYYDIFGVSPSASSDDINAAHKALAKMYHPDINSSEDAHEKMALLNKANEVLSDAKSREEYDAELRRTEREKLDREILSAQTDKIEWPRVTSDTYEQSGRAELNRKKAEARLKNVEAAQKQRMAQVQRKSEESVRKSRQAKVDLDKQRAIDELSALVMERNSRRNKETAVDDEQYYATKVLLSMVRKDDSHLQRMAEEADRKKRIDEILRLVKEQNDKKEWV